MCFTISALVLLDFGFQGSLRSLGVLALMFDDLVFQLSDCRTHFFEWF